MLDPKINAEVVTGLAVTYFHVLELRPLIGSIDVVRPIMAHQEEACVEIHRKELHERSSGTQETHDFHRDSGFDVTLCYFRSTEHRKTGNG